MNGRDALEVRFRSYRRGVLLVFAAGVSALAACGCGDGDADDAGALSTTASSGSGGSGGASPAGSGGSGGSSDGGQGGAGEGGSAQGGAGGGSVDPLYFAEEGGLVAVEAEHFISNDNQGTPRDWYLTTPSMDPAVTPDPDTPHADSASGSACLEGLPDTRVTHDDPIQEGESIFNNPGTGPELSYRIHFSTAGTYYVWVRAYSTGSEDNGIHVGIDDEHPTSGRRVQFCSGKNQWTWSSAQRDSGGSPCGQPNTITIDVDTPGEHIITFNMREDGFEFDKFVMTTDINFVPQDAGPPEQLYGG